MITKNVNDLNMRRLHHACAEADMATLDYLLDILKVDPDASDKTTETHRQTGTQRAAANGHLQVLKKLEAAGGDFFIVSRSGLTLEGIIEKHLREGDFKTSTRQEYEECLAFVKKVKASAIDLGRQLRNLDKEISTLIN